MSVKTPLVWEHGYRKVEEFQVGDRLAARSEFDPEGAIEWKAIEEVFVRRGLILEVTVAGQTIGTTAEHPFYLHGKGWTPAGELAVGDLLAASDGRWLPVERLYNTDALETVYNFRVAEHHTYFVGDQDWGFGVWAHNAYRVSNSEIDELAQYSKGGFSISTLRALAPEKHHIATIYGGVGKQLRSIFASANVSMEHVLNKTRVASHVGPHGDIYNKYVLDTLRTAVKGKRADARTSALKDALYQLRREIVSGDLDAMLKTSSR